MELKRSIEIRIKKRVKVLYMNGKFHDLYNKVIANPKTLKDAYNYIKLNSNIGLDLQNDDLCFSSMSEQLLSKKFDIKENILLFSSSNQEEESLVLPNLKLKIVQESIRLVLEVVFRPHFSRVSHGCRSGRSHHSALKYICKEIHHPDWWFTISMKQKLDMKILSKLICIMEERIDDTALYSTLCSMFDVQVLNLDFGLFPKGQGLPQEGVLSPILMNIYLDHFDRELIRFFIKFEGLGLHNYDINVAKGHKSMLRAWLRKQLHGKGEVCDGDSGSRLHACRFMDEIFIAVSGSRETAVNLKIAIENFLRDSLYLNLDDRTEILAVSSSRCVQFVGTIVRTGARKASNTRIVHKLKDKLRLFALQKREHWDAWTLKIGKDLLAHGLKKIKESEIEQLQDKNSMLTHISHFRKVGMKTEHWFMFLLKVWMQDLSTKHVTNEEEILSKYMSEPSLPQELRDSFYHFQREVENYVFSETASTLQLLSSIKANESSISQSPVIGTLAPINVIKKSLLRYGLVNSAGYPVSIPALILQDDIHIIYWFSGLVRRWIKWFKSCSNFEDVILLIIHYVRKSCIRTLAAKHRMHENLIEKRFESELSEIPSTQEISLDIVSITTDVQNSHGDESLMYGISYSGLCMLSLVDITKTYPCCVIGCSSISSGVYMLHVKEKRKFPSWKTGFSTSIHPSLNKKELCLCTKHVKDLYLGHISLQSIDFGASFGCGREGTT